MRRNLDPVFVWVEQRPMVKPTPPTGVEVYLKEGGGMRRNLDPVPVWIETQEEGRTQPPSTERGKGGRGKGEGDQAGRRV